MASEVTSSSLVSFVRIYPLPMKTATRTHSLADGRGEGFGNKISIQTVAIVKAAKAAGRVYSIDSGRPVRLDPSSVAGRELP